MEFGKILQQLRKKNNLTQEELAESIYISRTAISKWESGRGFPTIESLKMISKIFSVSVDELISGEELLSLAENEGREKIKSLMDVVFGILDCTIGVLLFLPFFGQQGEEMIYMVSLIKLTDYPAYIYFTYLILVALNVVMGIMILAFQNLNNQWWMKIKIKLSLIVNILLILILIASQQPYAAVFVFGLFLIKGILLIKK
ncbi:MAG TPA: helix-turn-helix transcriptional regulator [Candidatus Woesebacteria bacterium]|nr:helix-turn-helix transcriptional regulator [Candidatus Woesebacteria bacterium]HPJ17097.1 helix-turn-helix transcriptional regulator [Candidatus Woesebacteria bacterium]